MPRGSQKQQDEEKKLPTLQIPRDDAARQLQDRIEKGRLFLQLEITDRTQLDEARAEHTKWSDYNRELLRRMVDTDDFIDSYASWGALYFAGPIVFSQRVIDFRSDVNTDIRKLESILQRLDLIPEDHTLTSTISHQEQVPSSFAKLEQLLNRFHSVARQLQNRHNGRDTLIIQDEYDVQDLLHALLRIFFQDIRPEEHTPSYAGSSSRMDFLLKNERFVVEVKMASEKLKDKQVGEQLIVDIERYQSHQDCETLVCFVYDPNERIQNPAGLENDLNRKAAGIEVQVYILPKH